MCENLIEVETDDEYDDRCKESKCKLLVVEFYAPWCCHCKAMGSAYDVLAEKFPMAIFLKVNVDKCTDTAIDNKVKCLPSFIFFRDQMKEDAYCGNDSIELENLVRLWYHRATRDDKQDQCAK